MKNKKIELNNSKGIKLAAHLELPVDQHPKAYALFAHCFTCTKDLRSAKYIARALTTHGFGVMLFDFTGLGDSDGSFSDSDFSSNIQDLIDVADHMAEHMEAPQLLVGHSLGGTAVLFAARSLPTVRAVATIGAPSTPQHVRHLFQNKMDEIESQGKAEVHIGGRPFHISKGFVENLDNKNMQKTLQELNKALLIMHSPQDRIVEVENAAELYDAAMHPKSFVSLDGADHLLSENEDSRYAGNLIAQWASRYLKIEKKKPLRSHEQVVAFIGDNAFTTDIMAGRHALVADEPVSVGGNGFGPSPYDLLLAALGACTAMTLKMYADRKKWDLDSVTVHLNHGKDYIQDCENCDDKGSRIDIVDKYLEFSGKLDDKQKQRLIEIADKCPVHRTLNSPVKTRTTLLEDQGI